MPDPTPQQNEYAPTPAGVMPMPVPSEYAPAPEGVKPYAGPQEPGLIEKAVTLAGKPMEFINNMGTGALKSAAEGTVGLTSELLHRIPGVGETLVPTEGLEKEREMFERKGVAEKAGGLVEQAGEFALGEGELRAVGLLSRMEPWMLRLAHNNKFVQKLLMEAFKAGTVGAAQGAAHEGGASGKIAEGAEAGSAGGALGGAIGEAAGPALKGLARLLGLGGWTAEEAMTMAGRPAVKEARQGRWTQSLQRALPGIVKDAKAKGFKNLDEFTDIITDRARDLWNQEIQPQITRHANEQLSGASVANRVRSALRGKEGMAWAMTPEIFESETEGVKKIAKSFDNFNYTLEQADQLRQALNRKLSNYYRGTAEQKAAMRMTDGDVNAIHSAADALRDQIYGRLSALGEKTPAALRQEYGALKDIQRVFESRVPVDARQAPINVTQAIALLSGAAEAVAGNGLGAVATIGTAGAARLRNRPVSLVRQALEAAQPGAARRAVRAARPAAGAAGGFAGSQVGRLHFQASDGSMHEIPLASLDAARKIDPDLKVLSGPEK